MLNSIFKAMKNQLSLTFQTNFLIRFFLFIFLTGSFHAFANIDFIANDSIKFKKIKGFVYSSKTKQPLPYASLTINNTNISTVTNNQGAFLLKVPNNYLNQELTVSFLGYTSKVLTISLLNPDNTEIALETFIEELPEIKISLKNASSVIQEVLIRKGVNYINTPLNMTAFYRESIKKRRTYVSLTEAVLEISKQPYTNGRYDAIKLFKSRKSTDYEKLDTVAFKLKGGPYGNLYLDVQKYPDLFFNEDMLGIYDFWFDTPTKIDNRPIYVIKFKQKPFITNPQYFGKLYVDAETLTLISAKFSLNIDNKVAASKQFIVKKPTNAEVYPIQADYTVNYREKDGKWYFGYSRIQLGFKIKWTKKWFNSIYYSTSEIAVTDWEVKDSKENIKYKDRLRTSVIMSDEASGFNDTDFWGAYNIIEPDKPIETAISKIQRQLKRRNDSN